MIDIQYTLQDLEKKGQEIYESKLKEPLEKKHFGKYVAIDIESEDYFVADTLDDVLLKAKKKYPNKIFHSIKIGSAGVFKTSELFSLNQQGEWLFQFARTSDVQDCGLWIRSRRTKKVGKYY